MARVKLWPNGLGADIQYRTNNAEVLLCPGAFRVNAGGRFLVVKDPAIRMETRAADVKSARFVELANRCKREGERV